MQYKVDEVLEYLKNAKSRQELQEKFGLSNSESWHLVKWLEKAGLIEDLGNIHIAGRPNRLKLYRTKP